MKQFGEKYKKALELLKKEEYKKSFSLFQDLAIDENNSSKERSCAYSMMGLIAGCFDPDLAPSDDQSGLEFYQAALDLDPDNFDALRGVVNYFDACSPHIRHQDIDAFISAYNKLMSNPQELMEGEDQMLQNQYEIMQGVLKNKATNQEIKEKEVEFSA